MPENRSIPNAVPGAGAIWIYPVLTWSRPGISGRRLHEAGLCGARGQLGPGPGPRTLPHFIKAIFDGPARYPQVSGDLLITQTTYRQFQHLGLPGR